MKSVVARASLGARWVAVTGRTSRLSAAQVLAAKVAIPDCAIQSSSCEYPPTMRIGVVVYDYCDWGWPATRQMCSAVQRPSTRAKTEAPQATIAALCTARYYPMPMCCFT